MAAVPGQLIWEIVKKNNSFLVKEFGNGTASVQFSKEPNNLYNLNSYKHSGLTLSLLFCLVHEKAFASYMVLNSVGIVFVLSCCCCVFVWGFWGNGLGTVGKCRERGVFDLGIMFDLILRLWQVDFLLHGFWVCLVLGLRCGWVLNGVGKVFWVLRKWKENNGLIWSFCFVGKWRERGVFDLGIMFDLIVSLWQCDLMLFDFFDSLIFGTKAWLSLFLFLFPTKLGKWMEDWVLDNVGNFLLQVF